MPTPKGHSTFGAPHGICWSSYTSLCPISLSFLPPLVEVQRAYLSKCPEAHLWLKISLVNATVIMQLIVQSKSILWLKVKVLAGTLWTVTHQAPLTIEFSRQEYWSDLPFSSPGHLPDLGMKLGYPALQVDSLLKEHTDQMECRHIRHRLK